MPEHDSDQSETVAKSGDAANWAKPVERLRVETDIPQSGINLNVEGRKVNSPIQGFGRMWNKIHRVDITDASVPPADVISAWKANFGSFWPSGNHFYGPITGLEPGEVAVINLAMPGKQQLSTGVLVLYADDESFTLMTPQGHVFAGWITFSSYKEGDSTFAQAEILMRASDPVYEIGMELFGHRNENRFWEATLRNVAAHFDLDRTATTEMVLIDGRYQWKQAGNVWHNSAIRTGIYRVTSPVTRTVRKVRP
jgi:hypothetical protein